MGRPSLATTRRPQIVEAAQRVIASRGITGMTMARIATEAGVQTSLVSHYFGSKRAVLLATVQHAIEGYEAMLDEAVAGSHPENHFEELLEVSFGGHLLHKLYGAVIDEIRAAGNFDNEVKVALRGLYEVFHQTYLEAILDARPDADPEDASRIAYGMVCLFQTADSLDRLGFRRRDIGDGRVLARALLASLDDTAPPPTGHTT